MTEFDYRQAAQTKGWREFRPGFWERYGGGAYEGTARQLCYFIGVGPEFDAWSKEPYEFGEALK